jgi:hypothetical protein
MAHIIEALVDPEQPSYSTQARACVIRIGMPDFTLLSFADTGAH